MTKPFVRPDVQQLLDQIAAANAPPASQLGVEGARAIMKRLAAMDAPAPELAALRDLEIAASGGHSIPLRLHVPHDAPHSGPALLYLHGGGFTIGDRDCYQALCSALAVALSMPVISVEYRLAPEHPFPAAPDDCETAARWLAGNPGELDAEVTGLVICGDSAGGNLSAVTALALRDEPAAVPVVLQWLLYPLTDMGGGYASMRQFAKGYFLDIREVAFFNDCYAADGESWRASPMKGDTAGLPPTLIHTAGLDPLRDQGRAYAAKLAEAGVEVSYLEAEGTVHSFAIMRGAVPSGQADFLRSVAVAKAHLGVT